MAASKPGQIHRQIAAVMQRFPEGVSGGRIRQELANEGLRAEDQTHLDRRKRDLRKWFLIETSVGFEEVNGKLRKVTLYRCLGERPSVVDEGEVNQRIRAAVIHAAHGRCQMCGATVSENNIRLVVDHKTPRAWGGNNERENLWAICTACNAGKKDYFMSVQGGDEGMKAIMANRSVHVRIGEALKARGVGNRTEPELLEVAAGQEDWHKRLRELRYPVIGWEIEAFPYKTQSGRKRVDYILRSFKPWPDEPTAKIREYERRRKKTD